ncbi:MAG: 50S ribosomal protein L10 [Parcubacteria group bacterium Athens0714_26]|nr:MAG: 50S ribosomal protein L10 [Parcubacteria group bacterium Athens1014_26]TSD03665.1 MAG: 50S ribosomal protein L10 [Parcubacteria group bacterium Athens0714_26]
MALTKTQKKEQVSFGLDKIKSNQNLVFADFNKVSVENIKKLRRELKKQGADFKVLKKRLLKIALKDSGMDFDPLQFKTQLGTIFIPGDLSSLASSIYKFSREIEKGKKGEFKVLGGVDTVEKRFIDANEFNVIAKLPTREVLLAQIAMLLTMPMKKLLLVLNEKAKQPEVVAPSA